jgi:phosphate starvation-inducible membrane PsiE
MASRGLRLWSSLSGVVFVVLAVVGAIFLFDGPSDSSPAKMTSWYSSSSNRAHINIGWVLTGLGLFALIWFVAALRERVRESEAAAPEQGTFLSTIVLMGGTVYVAVAMAGIAIAGGIKTMSDDTYHHQVYSGLIHAAGDASYVLVVTAGAAMAALIFASSVAVRRYEILPRWVSWFGFVAGIAAIFSLFFFTMLVWLIWVAVASVSLFMRARPATAARREPSAATS